jgi:hypothetical protein
MFMLKYGKIKNYGIKKGQICVRHFICDNPPCCNYWHLQAGTSQNNIDDKLIKGRQGKIKLEAVPNIIALHSAGYSIKDISIMYSVIPQTISRIIYKKLRKYQ